MRRLVLAGSGPAEGTNGGAIEAELRSRGLEGLEVGHAEIVLDARRNGAADERLKGVARLVIRRDSMVRWSLAAADALSLLAALWIATSVVGGAGLTAWAVAATFPLILIAKVMGLYDRDPDRLHKTTLDELPQLLWLSTLTALAVWMLSDALVGGDFERRQVLAFWVAFFVVSAVLRAVARRLAVRVSPPERCLFVGDQESAAEFREKLEASPRAVRAELVGWIPAAGDGTAGIDGGVVERVRTAASLHEVHRAVLAAGPGSSEELVNAIAQVKDAGLKVSVLPRTAQIMGPSVTVDRLDGLTLLGIRRFEITRSSRLVKRTFDLAGASLALIVLSPLLAAIAIAIKLDSPGPVLFRQRRAGRHGEPFEMLKFRTMVDGADRQQEALRHLNEAEGTFKIANDPRVTRRGRSIRRLSLDELPQLINVFSGQMSLVGPRPLPLDEDRQIVGWHRRRLDLRPGMTGPWQILGSAPRVPLREMVKLDYRYVANWSLWNDVRILFLTIPHVVGRRGI